MTPRANPNRIFFRRTYGKAACLSCEKQVTRQGATTCPTCGLPLTYFNNPSTRIPAAGHRAGWRRFREWQAGAQPLRPRANSETNWAKRRNSHRILPRIGNVQW